MRLFLKFKCSSSQGDREVSAWSRAIYSYGGKSLSLAHHTYLYIRCSSTLAYGLYVYCYARNRNMYLAPKQWEEYQELKMQDNPKN